MDKIIITGLRADACHGLLDFERTIPQPFVADITLELDFSGIAYTDSISDTINYAEVCDFAREYIKTSRHALIEGLAEGLALGLLGMFARAESVTVRLSKPRAPVAGVWDGIAVETTRKREGS